MKYSLLLPLGLYLAQAYANIDFHFKDLQLPCDPEESYNEQCVRGQICSDEGK